MQSIVVFIDITNFSDFWWKKLMSAELRVCVTWFIYILGLLLVRYNCVSFIIVGYGWQILGRWAFLAPPPPNPHHREQCQKYPSWIELSSYFHKLLLRLDVYIYLTVSFIAKNFKQAKKKLILWTSRSAFMKL